MDVLYVTDGSPSVESTVTTLEPSPHRESAPTPGNALEDLASERVDCVVVDLVAPEGDDLEFLHRVRNADPDVPIVQPDGTVHWLAARGTAVTDGDGEPVRLLGIAVDVAGTLRRVATSVTDRYPEAEISRALPDRCDALAAPELEVALGELLENAIVHNDSKRPVVEVAVECGEHSVEVRVADDGPRIPEMEVDVLSGARSIDPLYHGSGLGLWVIYWVVKRSGGTVTFDYNEPRGNVVTLELPAGEEGCDWPDPARSG
ncbi:ATP-binding protein [Natrialbaceae archaeon A-gly3]